MTIIRSEIAWSEISSEDGPRFLGHAVSSSNKDIVAPEEDKDGDDIFIARINWGGRGWNLEVLGERQFFSNLDDAMDKAPGAYVDAINLENSRCATLRKAGWHTELLESKKTGG